MDINEIKFIINSVNENSTYKRVSANHPLELYLGLNVEGLKTLRFNGNFKPQKVVGNQTLDIKQIVNSNGSHSILFSFNSKENFSLFYSFCLDLISSTENSLQEKGYVDLINRYNSWKKLFYSNKKILDENEILGLIGELYFLKNYAFERFGESEALKGWSGPEPTHKDFSFNEEWFEIKSINNSKTYINISSIEQLDSNNLGHLYVYSFEKMSPDFNGETLNLLVKDVIEELSLDNDRDYFIEKLKKVGYAYDDQYDNYVYNFKGLKRYIVNENFPRLKAENMPKGIVNVKYNILLSNIESFKEE